MWKWILGVPVALFLAMLVIGAATNSPERERQREEEARLECTRAITSSMGTSTAGYADRKAYNDHVRDKCQGFKIPNLSP